MCWDYIDPPHYKSKLNFSTCFVLESTLSFIAMPMWKSQLRIFFFFFFFLAALGLCCYVWAFSSCERGLLFVVVRGLLIAVASLAMEHGL